MSLEIQLINQIEKFEFLYNTSLPEYNRKDLVDDAWMNIAANTNLSVSECKEKWRNIRSSFLRSMKPSGSKVKKPYYLTEYLKFILPFLKPINAETTEDVHFETPPSTSNHSAEVEIDYIKPEPKDYDGFENNENSSENGTLNDMITRQGPIVRKRRRFIPIGRRNIMESMKTKTRVTTLNQRNDFTQNVGLSSNNSAMKMFLISLLPELETMTEDQIRLFKIKSMMLIDDIKLNYPQMRENNSTAHIHTERLQKRLINLLLKNLQRASNAK